MAYSSAITYIVVNRQNNIIQHPYWGKIFPFQDDYVQNLIHSLYISNIPKKILTIILFLSSLCCTNTFYTDQHSRISQLPLS